LPPSSAGETLARVWGQRLARVGEETLARGALIPTGGFPRYTPWGWGKPTSRLWDDSFMESILEDLRNKSSIFAVLGLEGYNMPLLK